MRFEIRHSDRREEVFCDNDPVVFGRDPACDVVVRNPRCSRRHASVGTVPSGYQLLDMGSSNGVYVLGRRIESAIIREGDVFSMGDVFVRLLSDEIPPTLAITGREGRPLDRPQLPRGPKPPASPRPAAPPSQFARVALGVSSVAVGLVLVSSPLILGPETLRPAYGFAGLGALSIVSGVGFWARRSWASGVHYVLFTLWTLGCLLAPLGLVGIVYQLRGDDYPENDSFFAVVIGLTGILAMLTLIAASLLARMYVPAPLPP